MSGRYGVTVRPTARERRRADRLRDARRSTYRRVALVSTTTVFMLGAFAVVDTMPDAESTGTLLADRAPDSTDRSTDRSGHPVGTERVGRVAGTIGGKPSGSGAASPPPVVVESDPNVKPAASAALPANSGSGYRVVYDITGQQVWLVDDTDTVVHTYLVSGSRYDQLPAGTYEVFSTSEDAVSWHGTETMEYMVRFHRGQNSNIGFHDLPVASATGAEVQTLSQLGTPLSDGCIRQDIVDAKMLWDFAPVGTAVVVVRT